MHVMKGGAASEDLDPAAYLGPCEVVDATAVTASTLPATLATRSERVLYRTHGARATLFPRSFKGLSEALARSLAKNKVRLVGTDAPSMDAFDSKGLVAHKALFEGGCHVLENLDLSAAPPGRYELVALPLKVRGLCAAPVRALLKPLAD
jgi:arylformamidase